MIPEKKYTEHDHVNRCPACIEDETYKRLAKWILENKTNEDIDEDYGCVSFLLRIAISDYEALKKLASEGG